MYKTPVKNYDLVKFSKKIARFSFNFSFGKFLACHVQVRMKKKAFGGIFCSIFGKLERFRVQGKVVHSSKTATVTKKME
jgi:hypothetical protein